MLLSSATLNSARLSFRDPHLRAQMLQTFGFLSMSLSASR